MNIPPELQDRLIEVLRTAHDNAFEIYQEAQERYKGYKQSRIDALKADSEESGAVLDAVMELKATKPIGYAVVVAESAGLMASGNGLENGTYILHAAKISDNVQMVFGFEAAKKLFGEQK